MTDDRNRFIRAAVFSAADSAADAKGNGEDAERAALRNDVTQCIKWLELLEQNAKRAAFNAREAIDRIHRKGA